LFLHAGVPIGRLIYRMAQGNWQRVDRSRCPVAFQALQRLGYIERFNSESDMAKSDQRSNKMVKKPKKDTSPPKAIATASTRPMAPTTVVLPKGKMKDK